MVHHTKSKASLTPMLIAASLVVSGILAPVAGVRAADFEQQIRQKQAEQRVARYKASAYGQRADGIQGQINILQDKIAEIQHQISANTARQNDLNRQIARAKIKLEEQRGMLTANIKAMYIEGDISPLEMVASSKNIGDFVDKQEYRDRLKTSITTTMDEIERLKVQLNQQRKEVTTILDSQKTLRGDLATKNAQADQKLAATNRTKASFDTAVRKKAAEIAYLREQQRIANARFIGAAGSGPACGGGYPGISSGPNGTWGCNLALDGGVDNWGMYNRQCVSYTAFKVAQSGRHMPSWGTTGGANAAQWVDRAAADGIPYNRTPKAGSVAISTEGYYGHAMYVESVNGNGTINISQYNASWDGTYSYVTGVAPGGLWFIHF